MMFNAKTSALTALSLVCALLVGCGGGDAEAPPPPVASTPAGGANTPDTTSPTVTIANDTSAPTATGPVTFTFVFSEDVGVSFSTADVVVTGGTAGAFTRISGSQATVVVTPNANTTGRITVSVAPGTFADIAGNANTASATASKDYDTVVVSGCGAAAPTCAPTTTVPAGATVIYTEASAVPTFNPFPNWGQATQFAEATIAGNKSLKYTALNYEGLDWSTNPVNVTSKTKLHLDFWTPDMTSVKVYIISAGKENAVTQTLTTKDWNSVDIDLSAYTVPDLSAIIQIKLESTTGTGTLYVDNVYFWGGAGSGGGTSACGTTDPTCAPTTTVPAGATVIYTDAANVPTFNSCPNWGQATVCTPEQTIAGNKVLKYSSLNYEGLDWNTNAVDVSGKGKLHIDFWTPDMTSVKVYIISAGKENAVTQTLTTKAWNSVDIDLSSYTVPDLRAIIQIKLESTTGTGTLYVDNIYFWGGAAGASCGTTDPTCAPTTTVPAGSTVIYTDAANVPTFNSCPNWGQATVCTPEQTIAGNKVLKYSALNYEGLDWSTSAVDVSAKGKLHIDFWTPDMTSVKVYIISNGKENAVTQTLTTKAWNSVDIPLSSYTVPDLRSIIQIKLESTTGSGTLYVDNIYFWGSATTTGAAADMGSGGAVTLPLATAGDRFGFIGTGDGIFANDYIGPVDGLGNHALFAGATTTGTASGGAIGYFNDTAVDTSSQKLEVGGWVSGSSDQQGVPNFFRYAVLNGPASTFASSYMGLYLNAPSNGTVNVSGFASLKMLLWGPAGMYEQTNLNPTLEVVLAGPKVAGCTATGSGGTEIKQNLTANRKIGAASSYKLALSGFTVKGVCGTDTNGTAVASVLAKLARVVVTVPAASFNFTNANAGSSPAAYSTGVNLGPVAFTNN